MKSTNQSAPLALGQGDEPKTRRLTTMPSADLVLNVFGSALVVNRPTGSITCYPEPLVRSLQFMLPPNPAAESLKLVAYDRWFLYTLDDKGIVWFYPLSALRDEVVAQHRFWKQWCKDADQILVHQGYLLVVSSQGRRIQVWSMDSDTLRLSWEENEEIVPPPTHVFSELPFAVNSLVPMHGETLLLGLVGQQEIALLSTDGGVHAHDQTFSPDGIQDWVGTSCGCPKMAAVRPDGTIRLLYFSEESQTLRKTFSETLSGRSQGVVRPIVVNGACWFIAITSGAIRLINPLENLHDGSDSPLLTNNPQLYNAFGNLVTGIGLNQDATSPQQLSLFSAERNGGLQRRRFWSIDRAYHPLAPPAGFGRSLYLLCKKGNTIGLICYDLLRLRT